MEQNYFRTRRFLVTQGEEQRHIYWVAVKRGEGNYSLFHITDKTLGRNSLTQFLPETGESSIVEKEKEQIGLEEALSFLDSQEERMLKDEKSSLVEKDTELGGWHFICFAANHRVNYQGGFLAQCPHLYRQMAAIQPEHLVATIHRPLFSEDKKDNEIVLTQVYGSPSHLGWIKYARAIRVHTGVHRDLRWVVQEVSRQVAGGLSASAPPLENISDLVTPHAPDRFTVFLTLANWEAQQALIPHIKLVGPEDLSEAEKENLQRRAMGENYFRVAAEQRGFVFDIFGMPHEAINGLPLSDGLFPLLNPESPAFPAVQRLLSLPEMSPKETPNRPISLDDETLRRSLALYFDSFLFQSGLSQNKPPEQDDPDVWGRMVSSFQRKLKGSAQDDFRTAAGFLQEQEQDIARRLAETNLDIETRQQAIEDAENLSERQRKRDIKEHEQRMSILNGDLAYATSERDRKIKELDAQIEERRKNLENKSTALEELGRKIAEADRLLDQILSRQGDLQAAIERKGEAVLRGKAAELKNEIRDFREAALSQGEGMPEPHVSVRIPVFRLHSIHAVYLMAAFSQAVENGRNGVTFRIDLDKKSRTPENILRSTYNAHAEQQRENDRYDPELIVFKNWRDIKGTYFNGHIVVNGPQGYVADLISKEMTNFIRYACSGQQIQCDYLYPKFGGECRINESSFFVLSQDYPFEQIASEILKHVPFNDAMISQRLECK